MVENDAKISLPLRYILGSLIPITITAWYFVDKIGGNSPLLGIVVVLAAIGIQTGYTFLAVRARKKRRHLFWPIILFITGNGKLPMRIFVVAIVLITIVALGFEISGFESSQNIPSSFIARFVEVDLYWTVLNFLGTSDNTLQPIGLGKLLTIVAGFSGLWFWGLYISVLVTKSLELVGAPHDSNKKSSA